MPAWFRRFDGGERNSSCKRVVTEWRCEAMCALARIAERRRAHIDRRSIGIGLDHHRVLAAELQAGGLGRGGR